MTEKECQDAKIAAFYEMRLILKKKQKDGKVDYTVDELYDLLDDMAEEKEKET